jgi:hypothetical protein
LSVSRIGAWTFNGLGQLRFTPTSFYVTENRQGGGDVWEFRLSRTRQRGYDYLVFEYNPAIHRDLDDAFRGLWNSLRAELDVYYQVLRVEESTAGGWALLEAQQHAIVELHQAAGFKAWWARYRTAGSALHAIFVDAARFELTTAQSAQAVRSHYRNTYRADEDSFLQDDVDREIAERFEYSAASLVESLKYLETRRLTSIEVVSVTASAIGGGIVGALIAAATR